MSGTTTEVFVKNVPVTATLVGVTVLGYTDAGSYTGIESSAFAAGTDTGQPVDGVQLSDATPLSLGTAVPGTALVASRADHKHPMPNAAQVGAAPTVHTHGISDVTNLQLALDGKAAIVHTHSTSQVTGLDSALAGKAPLSHQHPASDISGLDSLLSNKENIAAKGAPNGYPPLDSSGKVPAGFLPASSGTGGTGTGASFIDSFTADGQTLVSNLSTGRATWVTPAPITADRTPTVERNAATVLSFLDYNRRNIVLSGNAPLTLAASEIGTAPNQGMEFVIYNTHTAVNTITFGAGITVDPFPVGTGTAGAVKIGATNGLVAVSVMPVGTKLIAVVRGQIV